MADEQINNPAPATAPVEKHENRAQERIEQLSEKVALTSKERDELKSQNETITRERDFFAGFSDVVATNPSAKDHKDEILAKVKGGYTVEDATYAVLGKAGKLGQPQAAQQHQAPTQVAGGSAVNQNNQGVKTPKEMTQAERRQELSKMLVWE